jgi:alpha-N-arabinofuranosidase
MSEENTVLCIMGHFIALLHHCYGKLGTEGSSTQFDEKEYFGGVKNALYMETLVKNYSAMMNNMIRKKK